MNRKPLVVIVGPTASGKSMLALDVAIHFGGEIICADSRTVYKGMDIGTAKPSKADRALVPHHLLDIVEPNQPFTAADFKRLAQVAIEDIISRGKLPILVGGTGLYIDAIIFDYQFGKPADPERRAELQALTIEQLQHMCADEGIPLPTNELNRRHLVRAIELGGLISPQKSLRPETIVVGITTDRSELRTRIEARAHLMVDEGVLQEVQTLANAYGWKAEAMTANIYRIFRPVIEDKMTLNQAIELFITSDMQLAKRQITWLKRNQFIIWGEPAHLKTAIEHFVQQNNS